MNEYKLNEIIMMREPGYGEPRYIKGLITGETKTLWKITALNKEYSFLKSSNNEYGTGGYCARYLQKFDQAMLQRSKDYWEHLGLVRKINNARLVLLNSERLKRILAIIEEKGEL